MPVAAVSSSRISPTMITSGSARRNERMAAANVKPIFGCTWTCRSPYCVISTGSSAVQILRSGLLMKPSTECRLVVLPEPVGPTTRMSPYGFDAMPLSSRRLRSVIPSFSMGIGSLGARARITMSSLPPPRDVERGHDLEARHDGATVRAGHLLVLEARAVHAIADERVPRGAVRL